MALVRKNMSFSKLTSTSADIYSPSSTDGLVHNITLHNGNATTETVILNYNNGSDEYPIFNMSLTANETVILQYGNEGLYVEDAGKITGYATTTSYVTCKMDGTEEA